MGFLNGFFSSLLGIRSLVIHKLKRFSRFDLRHRIRQCLKSGGCKLKWPNETTKVVGDIIRHNAEHGDASTHGNMLVNMILLNLIILNIVTVILLAC